MLLLKFPSRASFSELTRVGDDLKLERAGLKTIVVMAGGCALQANPRLTQPRT